MVANIIPNKGLFGCEFTIIHTFPNFNDLIQKILGTAISGSVLLFNLGAWNTFPAFFNNWAYSLSQLESLSAGGQRFVDQVGATGYVDAGLIPSDPVSMVFWLGITIALFLGIWTAPQPKE